MTNNDFKWINIGNFKAVEFLEKSLKNDQLANFYIFSGPTGLGKFALAKNFAKNISGEKVYTSGVIIYCIFY